MKILAHFLRVKSSDTKKNLIYSQMTNKFVYNLIAILLKVFARTRKSLQLFKIYFNHKTIFYSL